MYLHSRRKGTLKGIVTAMVAAGFQPPPANSNVVILGMGERPSIEGEGHDRTNLGLPGNQGQLIEAIVAVGKPIVLVLENGRPLTIGWAKQHVPAILEAWYPGGFGGQAIAETLFGENTPSGHLTVTFPRSTGSYRFITASIHPRYTRTWMMMESHCFPSAGD